MRAGVAARVGPEAVDVVDHDREVELQRPGAVALGHGAAQEVLLPERDVAEHLLGETDAGHVAAASLAGVVSRMRSAKRSASAAIVKLGLGPTGPGMTEPSATYSPG